MTHNYECWADREGVCRADCSCPCHYRPSVLAEVLAEMTGHPVPAVFDRGELGPLTTAGGLAREIEKRLADRGYRIVS